MGLVMSSVSTKAMKLNFWNSGFFDFWSLVVYLEKIGWTQHCSRTPRLFQKGSHLHAHIKRAYCNVLNNFFRLCHSFQKLGGRVGDRCVFEFGQFSGVVIPYTY